MNVLHMIRWCTATALVALVSTIGLNQRVAAQQSLPSPQQQASAAGQDDVEVLTRGPVHEAFAATITFDPEPGLVALQPPPADIEELPPEQRPEGENLTWIPGYWAWDDDERNDYLWVSGIWRALPPGRQWVPGYWGQSLQGAQWTSGYWADAAADEIDYLPEPPATVEAGPNIAAPSADHIWLPGCWIWQQNRYAWRPGYWTMGYDNWDWVPDYYVWTPSGYVFVGGYYDYSVPHRGVVFAPVYFHGGLRAQRGFTYSPSIVINSGVFASHLFLRPGYGHYYFGDYYGSNYQGAGFSPWLSYHTSHRGYDPIYANQRWQHRRDHDWERRAKATFRNLRDNEDARPPRTWAAHREFAGRGETSSRRSIEVATPLEELAQREDARLRFRRVAPEERQQLGQRGQRYRQYLQQRQQLETKAARTPGEDATTTAPARRPLPRSPFVASPVEQLDKNDAPPRRHAVLKPDLQVEPQPRTRGARFGARPNVRQGAAGAAQQQEDPPARRGAGSQPQRQAQPQAQQPQPQRQAQPQAQQPQRQRQRASQGNRQGASADQSPGPRANRGQPQGASNDQSQGSRANRGQPRGASNDQSQGPRANRGQPQGASNDQSQGSRANRGQPQGASNDQSQGSRRNQRRGESNQEDKD